jgi:hypothetical protein
LCAYLGESDQFGWWRTSFLSPTGRRYLEFNFPRTVLSAGLNSAAEPAKELHDRRIGRNGVFHVFRLPHDIEQDIHLLLATEFKMELDTLIQGRELAMKALAELAEGERVEGEGPVFISGIAQLMYRPSLRKVASCYSSAFGTGKQVFPYFTIE